MLEASPSRSAAGMMQTPILCGKGLNTKEMFSVRERGGKRDSEPASRSKRSQSQSGGHYWRHYWYAACVARMLAAAALAQSFSSYDGGVGHCGFRTISACGRGGGMLTGLEVEV